MSIRRLHRRLGQLAEHAGLGRCACGAYLPPEVTNPPGVIITEQYDLAHPLNWLLRQASLAEARELQALLNRWLERCPTLATRRGTSHLIFGADPSESPLLRFGFADEVDTRPHCPHCGRAVELACPVKRILLGHPPPADLPDALQRDARLAPRATELMALWQQRADLGAGPRPDGAPA